MTVEVVATTSARGLTKEEEKVIWDKNKEADADLILCVNDKASEDKAMTFQQGPLY
jgi:hypothetical protein